MPWPYHFVDRSRIRFALGVPAGTCFPVFGSTHRRYQTLTRWAIFFSPCRPWRPWCTLEARADRIQTEFFVVHPLVHLPGGFQGNRSRPVRTRRRVRCRQKVYAKTLRKQAISDT